MMYDDDDDDDAVIPISRFCDANWLQSERKPPARQPQPSAGGKNIRGIAENRGLNSICAEVV